MPSLPGKSWRQHFSEYLWPSNGNQYQPRIFRSGQARRLLLVILTIKIATLSSLFFLFPDYGFLTPDIKQDMYRLINVYRSSHKLPPLISDPYLDRIAWQRAQDMSRRGYFSHVTPDGQKPWQWLDSGQYDFTVMGENLARNFLTADSVFRAFQKSPTHDHNLLSARYEDIGIGVARQQQGEQGVNIMAIIFGQTADHLGSRGASPAQSAAVPSPDGISLEPNNVTQLQLQVVQSQTVSVAAVLGQAVKKADGVVTESWLQDDTAAKSRLTYLVSWERKMLAAFLAILVFLAAANILVKIKVQHSTIIAQSIALIVVTAAALGLNAFTASAVTEAIRILGFWFS